MCTKTLALTIVLALQLMQGGLGSPQQCGSPGFYLSADQKYCFAYSALTREAYYHSSICESYASTLVTIDSAEKQTQVESFLTDRGVTNSNRLYIGLTNILMDESVWVWYGGNITSYTNWATNQPATINRGNCVYLYNGTPDYKWRAEGCLNGYYGMCERAATAADLL